MKSSFRFFITILVICFISFLSYAGKNIIVPKANNQASIEARNQEKTEIDVQKKHLINNKFNMPVFFIPNHGQYDKRVVFYTKHKNSTVFITKNGLVFDYAFSNSKQKGDKFNKSQSLLNKNSKQFKFNYLIKFKNSNKNTEIKAYKKLKGKINFLIGNDPEKWKKNIPIYEEIVYKNVYDNIDLRLYNSKGNLRYDFIVHPGGNPEDINLVQKGIDNMEIIEGELITNTIIGKIKHTKPYIYQNYEGTKNKINGGFKINDSNFGFWTDRYNPKKTLIIDPALMTLPYSTFLGGSGEDIGYDIVYHDERFYVTGSTDSSDFPVTTGAYQTSIGSSGLKDVFVAKFNHNNSGSSSLVYCTYIGGSGSDSGYGIDVYSYTDEAYITGATYSSDFPVVNSVTSYSASSDIFLVRLNSTGTGIVQSLVYGTNGLDYGNAVSVQGPQRVWITGITSDGNSFPSGSNKVIHGDLSSTVVSGDAFVSQVVTSNTDPGDLGVSIILGGSYWDEGYGIDVDSTTIYVSGRTESSDFPTSTGAYQTSFRGGTTDAFVAKLGYGGDLSYSTFLGSSNEDYGFSIAMVSGGACVVGTTYGSNFPTTANAYDGSKALSNYASGFLTKINSSGSSLDYSTFVESQDSYQHVNVYDISSATNNDTHVWITGDTSHAMFYSGTDKNYYQTFQGGNSDAFVARFSLVSSGDSSLISISHLGGSSTDYGKGVAADNERVFVTGYTSSSDFPTNNASQNTKDSGKDAFVSVLEAPLPSVTTNAATNVSYSSATLNGTLDSTSGAPLVDVYFEWGTSQGGPYPNSQKADSMTSAGSFSYDLSGLSSSQTYYYRTRAETNGVYEDVYEGEKSFTTLSVTTPSITTDSISNITDTTASGGGNVTDNGGASVTARGVCWNTSGSPTTSDTCTTNGTGTGSFTSSLTGLTSGTTYYVRAYATNSEGTTYGNQQTFTTLELPTVSTNSVTNITDTTATSAGNVTDNGGASVTSRGVCWNTSGSPTTSDTCTTDGTGTGSFTSSLTGLNPGTTYYVRAYATNSVGTSYGSQRTFTTLELPTVSTNSVTNITDNTATSGGNVTDNGGASVTARGVCWNTSGSPTTSDTCTSDGTGTGSFTSSLTGLNPGTTYYVRAYATNSVGSSYGSQRNFATQDLASVTTNAVTNVTDTSASSGGNVTDDGGASVTARGVCWNTSGSPTTSDTCTSDGTGTGNFTSSLTGLNPGTTYYVRAYATNSVGTSYGSQRNFTTQDLASVTTDAVTNITDTSADSGGNVTDDGGATVTSRGVCWNTTGNPTTADTCTTNGSGTGTFTSSLTGLTSGTTYYVRAYAINSVGTSYGSPRAFSTHELPNVITNTTTNITINSATSGGNVTDGGGTSVTARGVCWNTTGYPTTSDNCISNGTGTGPFISFLTGLISNTTYYVRAFATNSVGTSYGQQESFTTLPINKIEIVQPEHNSIVKGTVSIKANATTKEEIVKFYIDNEFLGDGKLLSQDNISSASKTENTFDIKDASYFFIDEQFNLRKITPGGGIKDVFEFKVKVDDININKTGDIFIHFKNGISLEKGFYQWIKINTYRGQMTGLLEPQFNETLETQNIEYVRNVFLNRLKENQRIDRIFRINEKELLFARRNTSSRNTALVRVYEPEINKEFDVLAYLKQTPIKIIRNTLTGPFFPVKFGYYDNSPFEGADSYTYIIDWNTLNYSTGVHTIKVIAEDKHGRTASDEINVKVRNLIIKLNAIRKSDRAFTFEIHAAELSIEIQNPGNIEVSEYIIHRKADNGSFEQIAAVNASEFNNNTYTYFDKNLNPDTSYTYKVTAHNSSGQIISVSEQKII